MSKYSYDVYKSDGFKVVVHTTEEGIRKLIDKYSCIVMVVKMYYEGDMFKRETIFVR